MSQHIALEGDKTIELRGRISTTKFGYQKLMKFYADCKKNKNITIEVWFNNLIWIDANMVAVFQGIIYKLEIENNLIFLAVLPHASTRFNILFNNGFFKSDDVNVRNTGTSIGLRGFLSENDDEYVNYVENDLLDHSGVNLTKESKDIIVDALIEVFNNYEIHSKTTYPIFVCGQFYPQIKTFKFTIFDLGVGFLDPIRKKEPSIKCYNEAINWALKLGNSTKEKGIPGGLGLYELKKNLLSCNGNLEIISGNAYMCCSLKDGKDIDRYSMLNCINVGTTINLFFKGF